MLKHDRLIEVLEYRPDTGEFIRIASPSKRAIGQVAGSTDSYGYRQIKIDGRLYLAHRLAFFYVEGEWPIETVDHRDLDRSNNRWSNLRHASRSENQHNKAPRQDTESGFKGVTKNGRGWRARTTVGGKERTLGTFPTAKQAFDEFTKASKVYHREFSRVA